MFGEDGVVGFCTDEDLAAYRRLYNLEAYLRYLVRWELVALRGVDWFNSLGGVRTAALKTQKEERELGIIDYDRRNLLSYTVANDLQGLIDGAIWPAVRDWMPRADLLTAELDVLRALRNKSAHLRQLTARDLRSLDRIEQTLVHCTSRYREVRREATEVESLPRSKVPTPLRAGLKLWLKDAADETGRWTDVRLRIVGPYVRLDARLRVGALHPDAIAKAVDEAGTDAMFMSVDAPTGRLSAYVPLCLGRAPATAIFKALLNLHLVGDALEEGPVTGEFFDFVFPIYVELPAALRV